MMLQMTLFLRPHLGFEVFNEHLYRGIRFLLLSK